MSYLDELGCKIVGRLDTHAEHVCLVHKGISKVHQSVERAVSTVQNMITIGLIPADKISTAIDSLTQYEIALNDIRQELDKDKTTMNISIVQDASAVLKQTLSTIHAIAVDHAPDTNEKI